MIYFLSFTDAFWQQLNIKKGDRPKLLKQTVPPCSSTKLQGSSAPNFVAFSLLILNKKSQHLPTLTFLSKSICCCAVSMEAELISFCTILMPMHVFSNLKAYLRNYNDPLFRKSFAAWYLHPTRHPAMLSLKSVTSAREGLWQGERSLAKELSLC